MPESRHPPLPPVAEPHPLAALLARLSDVGALRTGTGRGVRVGLLDGGVDPGLAGTGSLVEAVFRLRDGVVTRTDGVPGPRRNPHGSAVAQILRRMAPGAELVSADVLDEAGRGTAELLPPAIDWLLEQGCRVINVSLGVALADIPRPERRLRLAEAVERADAAGAVIVAAAHNLHEAGVDAVPACFAPVVSVNKRMLGDPERPAWRPDGRVEFEAYSKSLLPAYRHQAATSFAAPHVAGLVARLLSECPDLKPFEVKTILYRWAERDR